MIFFVQSLFDEGVCPDTAEALTKVGAEIGLEAEAVKNVISNDDNIKNVRKRAKEWATVGVSGNVEKRKEKLIVKIRLLSFLIVFV